MIKRIIARLDIKNNFLVKGMQLEGLRIIGYPEFFAEKYYHDNIDEIVFHDVVASLYKRNHLNHLISKVSQNVFVPIIVGGGIRSIEAIKEALINGADRVAINTAAINNLDFVKEAIKIFGSSTISLSIETLKIDNKYKVFTESGRTSTNLDTFEWIKRLNDLNVGEIILTSINNEGTGKGFDLDLFEKARMITNKSLLAHGGTKKFEDVYKLFSITNVDGVVIASAFHFNYYKELLNKKDLNLKGSTNILLNRGLRDDLKFSIKELKNYLKKKKIDVR